MNAKEYLKALHDTGCNPEVHEAVKNSMPELKEKFEEWMHKDVSSMLLKDMIIYLKYATLCKLYYEEGLGTTAIGEKTGYTRQNVWYMIRELETIIFNS